MLSGTHTISAPIVLAGPSLVASTTAGGVLDLSGNVSQAPGVSAGLSLSGGGKLILSGTNSYSDGTTVIGGTLDVMNPAPCSPGSSLTVGDGNAFAFDHLAASSLITNSPVAAPVPEPNTVALLAAGAVGLLGCGLRRSRAVNPANVMRRAA